MPKYRDPTNYRPGSFIDDAVSAIRFEQHLAELAKMRGSKKTPPRDVSSIK